VLKKKKCRTLQPQKIGTMETVDDQE